MQLLHVDDSKTNANIYCKPRVILQHIQDFDPLLPLVQKRHTHTGVLHWLAGTSQSAVLFHILCYGGRRKGSSFLGTLMSSFFITILWLGLYFLRFLFQNINL